MTKTLEKNRVMEWKGNLIFTLLIDSVLTIWNIIVVQVVKYMVRHVQQFPSDTDCYRFISTISEKVYFLVFVVHSEN